MTASRNSRTSQRARFQGSGKDGHGKAQQGETLFRNLYKMADVFENAEYHRTYTRAVLERAQQGTGKSKLMNGLFRLWSIKLREQFSVPAYLEFYRLAQEDGDAGFEYGVQCLFRFYSYGLEGRFDVKLLKDFEALVLAYYRRGDLYGLEKYWALLHYNKLANLKGEANPYLLRLVTVDYPDLGAFKSQQQGSGSVKSPAASPSPAPCRTASPALPRAPSGPIIPSSYHPDPEALMPCASPRATPPPPSLHAPRSLQTLAPLLDASGPRAAAPRGGPRITKAMLSAASPAFVPSHLGSERASQVDAVVAQDSATVGSSSSSIVAGPHEPPPPPQAAAAQQRRDRKQRQPPPPQPPLQQQQRAQRARCGSSRGSSPETLSCGRLWMGDAEQAVMFGMDIDDESGGAAGGAPMRFLGAPSDRHPSASLTTAKAPSMALVSADTVAVTPSGKPEWVPLVSALAAGWHASGVAGVSSMQPTTLRSQSHAASAVVPPTTADVDADKGAAGEGAAPSSALLPPNNDAEGSALSNATDFCSAPSTQPRLPQACDQEESLPVAGPDGECTAVKDELGDFELPSSLLAEVHSHAIVTSTLHSQASVSDAQAGSPSGSLLLPASPDVTLHGSGIADDAGTIAADAAEVGPTCSAALPEQFGSTALPVAGTSMPCSMSEMLRAAQAAARAAVVAQEAAALQVVVAGSAAASHARVSSASALAPETASPAQGRSVPCLSAMRPLVRKSGSARGVRPGAQQQQALPVQSRSSSSVTSGDGDGRAPRSDDSYVRVRFDVLGASEASGQVAGSFAGHPVKGDGAHGGGKGNSVSGSNATEERLRKEVARYKAKAAKAVREHSQLSMRVAQQDFELSHLRAMFAKATSRLAERNEELREWNDLGFAS